MPAAAKNTEIFASDYSVNVGDGALFQLERDLCLLDYSRKYILVDENTIQHCLPLVMNDVPSLRKAEVIEIESGEKNKTVDICSSVWSVLAELQADRQSLMVNLGGGVIGDMGGFIAATYKRGIDFINVPTTLLSQVDASVGGKVGVDLQGLKNMVGLFRNPKGVYVYPQFLKTLPKSEVMAGFAEMLKHGLIQDATHFDELLKFSFSQIEALEPHIIKSIQIKNRVVLDDPLEKGVRKLLNFGHTIGHALETYSMETMKRGLLHGEAVAIGMLCEAYLSQERLELDAVVLEKLSAFVLTHYPPFSMDALAHHRLIEIMRNDKKNVGDELNFSLLRDAGDAVHDQQVSADEVVRALDYYQSRIQTQVHAS